MKKRRLMMALHGVTGTAVPSASGFAEGLASSGIEVCAESFGCRSRGRMEANHRTTQMMPLAPITWNGKRQPPGSSVIIARMTSGVMMAPMEAPLCSTLLPIVRSRGESSRNVVFNAQGQSVGAVEIEDRGSEEVAPGRSAVNPAFDVTPDDLVTAIVTDARTIRLDRGERP